MYPPRKSYESNSNSKNKYVSGYVSPSHRDNNKINRILENAKKYVNTQQQKKDYMSQGIISLKKKEAEEVEANPKKRKSSEVSNKSSQKGEDIKQDIYRKINSVDQEKQQKIQEVGRDKRLSGTISAKQDRSVKRLSNNQNIEDQKKKDSNWQFRQEKRNYQPTTVSNEVVDQKYTSINHNSNSYVQSNIKSSNLKNHQNEDQKNLQNKVRQITKIPNETMKSIRYQQQNMSKVQSPLSKIIYESERERINFEPSNKKYQQKDQRGNTYKGSNRATQQNASNKDIMLNQHINYIEANKESQGIKKGSDYYHSNTLGKQKIENLNNQTQKMQVKVQVDKLTDQITELRRKYYRVEQERVSLMEKFKINEQENQRLRSENQSLIVKIKKMQFQINSLENYRNIAEAQIRQFQSNKEVIYDDVMQKINQLTNDLRKKSLEATNYERELSQMQRVIEQKEYEIKRGKQALMGKDEEILNLQQKQYQYNKLNSIHNKTEFQAKVLAERVSTLQNQNSVLRQQKASLPILENQLLKNRKQIQQMIEDMKSLQNQLQQKDSILQSYKNLKHQNNQGGQRESIHKQLQSIMKQKAEIVKKYEQRLIDKDKQIYQLEMNKQNSQRTFPKLGGLEAQVEQFQKILANQLQQINKLKRQNHMRISQIFQLKVELENLRYNLINEENKCRILALQMQSNSKNSSSLAQSQLRVAKNQIESLNRRIQHMNNTIESKRRENENKDEFIKKFLISQGSTQQQDISILLQNLEKILSKKPLI